MIKKLTLIVGFISTLVMGIAIFFMVEYVFYSTEKNIQNDLSNHYEDIVKLANPAKSEELAVYLRSNDLSLFIFNDKGETIARYGIYRNLNLDALQEYTKLTNYVDKKILDYGEYDIFTKNNIQIANKNTVLYILRNSFYISFIVLLPVIWILSVAAATFANKIVLSPLIKAKNISHELKTPLARVSTTLQTIIDDAPDDIKDKIKYSIDELVQLGGNVDSLLSLSLLKKKTDSASICDLKIEVAKFTKNISDDITVQNNIKKSILVPLSSNYINVIMRNLFHNATKYNRENGFIKIDAFRNSKVWSFNIKNSVTNKIEEKGYGLGMTIVKDICHNNDLKINIDSTNKLFSVKIEGRYV